MEKIITRTTDPLSASVDSLLVITFQKSTSKSYPLAVNVSQGASNYTEMNVGNKLVHFVKFNKTREDAGRAHTLISYISGWKGIQIFTGGKLVQNTWQVNQVLDCFLEASGCNDWRAHCYKIIDDPFIDEPEDLSVSFSINMVDKPRPKQSVDIDRYTFPCDLLQERFRFQIDHPSKPEDQIQAGAVKYGCDWCPHFDAKNFKKSGNRTVIKDFFE